jgi:hypothetical protein
MTNKSCVAARASCCAPCSVGACMHRARCWQGTHGPLPCCSASQALPHTLRADLCARSPLSRLTLCFDILLFFLAAAWAFCNFLTASLLYASHMTRVLRQVGLHYQNMLMVLKGANTCCRHWQTNEAAIGCGAVGTCTVYNCNHSTYIVRRAIASFPSFENRSTDFMNQAG